MSQQDVNTDTSSNLPPSFPSRSSSPPNSQSSINNNNDNNTVTSSSTRWGGVLLPWSRRSSRSHGLATETEVLEAMKRVNTQALEDLSEGGEHDNDYYYSVDLNDPQFGYQQNQNRTDFQNSRVEMFESGELSTSTTRSSQPPRYSQPGSTAIRDSAGRRSQQESVHSMQQFYHQHYRNDSQPLWHHDNQDFYDDFQQEVDILDMGQQQQQQHHHRNQDQNQRQDETEEHSQSMQAAHGNHGFRQDQHQQQDQHGAPPKNSQEDDQPALLVTTFTTTTTTTSTNSASVQPSTLLKTTQPRIPAPLVNKALARLTHQSSNSSSSSHSYKSQSSSSSSTSSATAIPYTSPPGLGMSSSSSSSSPLSSSPNSGLTTTSSPVTPNLNPYRVNNGSTLPDSPSTCSTATTLTTPPSPYSSSTLAGEQSSPYSKLRKAFDLGSEIEVHDEQTQLHPHPQSASFYRSSTLTLSTDSSEPEQGKCVEVVDEYSDEPCLTCHIINWETFKAGLLPTSSHPRNALLAAVLVALVTIALEAVLLQRHTTMIALATGTSAGAGIDPIVIAAGGPFEISQFRPLTVYYFLFILAEIFAVGLLWDAAIHKNSLQVVAFTLFEWCMVSYSGLQIWQHDQLVKDIGIPAELLVRLGDSTTRLFLFTQLGVQIVACSGITLLTWRLYSEFGWLVFQKLGADVSLRKMMKEYRLLFTLLKLDAFFFLAYAIQIATLTDKLWQKGLIEVAVAIPLSAVIITLGFHALRHENKVTMSGFISCLGLLIAYMTYRIYALYQTVTGDRMTDPYFLSRKTMTVFAALTLFMTVLALINAIVMVCNFNKGLKEAMQQYHLRRSNTIRSVTTVSLHHLPHLHPHNNHTLSGSGRPLSLDAIHSDTARGNGRHGLGPGHGRGSSGCRAAVAIVRSSTIKSHAPTDSGGGEGGGSGRNSKRTSRRSMLHCESTTTMTPAPVVMERWQIE